MSFYSSWKCKASAISSTYFYGSSTCTQCGGGGGCTSMYKYMADLPTITGEYTLYKSYQNATTCAGSASYLYVAQGPCRTSPCAAQDMGGDNTTSMSIPMQSATTCPNALPVGTVKTGFAVMSANYASTDTSCASTPTSVTYYPVGKCLLSTSSDGTTSGSYMYTADSGKNLFASYYDYSSTGNTCTGTPSVTTLPKQACTCLSDR